MTACRNTSASGRHPSETTHLGVATAPKIAAYPAGFKPLIRLQDPP